MKTEYEPHNWPKLYRSLSSNLTDDELLILDVMFSYSVTYPMLRACNFVPQFNSQSHTLTDDQLKSTLRRMVADGIVEPQEHRFRNHRYVSITAHGGELWASERCPIWDRYCTESYPAFIRGRTIMSVKCVSSFVRDDFLRLWPEYPARTKTATVRDNGLIHWRDFGTLHVGLASYTEPTEWTPDEYNDWLPKLLAYMERVETERSWWRSVDELQKFVDR